MLKNKFWDRFSIFCLVALLSGWEEKARAGKQNLLKDTINLGQSPSTKAKPPQETHQPHSRAPFRIRQQAADLLIAEAEAHTRLSSDTLYQYVALSSQKGKKGRNSWKLYSQYFKKPGRQTRVRTIERILIRD